jgi:hypothetical protein
MSECKKNGKTGGRVERFVQVLGRLPGGCGLRVALTVSEIVDYEVRRLPTDFTGCEAFGVRKAGQQEEYSVLLDHTPEGGGHTCSCRGFERWQKPCRHLDAVAALLKAGKL